jgi:hypothetical protein
MVSVVTDATRVRLPRVPPIAWLAGRPDRRELVSFAFAAGGVAWFLIQAVLLAHKWTIPGGDIQNTYIAAGVAMREGISPYYLPGNPVPYFYAPPWAVLFAGLSYLPPVAAYVLVVAAEIAALRYMAGDWRRFCLLLWFPLLPFELLGGAINLILAASIVAAIRGYAWLATLGILAKLSPAIAVDRRQWRRYVVPVALAVLVTLPWFWLWEVWIGSLLTALTGPPLGPYFPIPFAVRLVLALALAATRRPWAMALGAAIATPAFYFVSLVLLIAPLTIAFPSRSVRRGATQPAERRHDFERVA